MIALGKPSTNAGQERDFNRATWLDSNLVQSQKPKTLEDRHISVINRDSVNNMKKLLEEVDEDIARKTITLDEPKSDAEVKP